MTRAPRRFILAVSAALAIAFAAYAQHTPYANQPLVAEAPYGADIGRETSCGVLRARYQIDHNVWRGGVKDGHDQAVEPHLIAMRMVLRRLAWLESRGRCGG